jgi:hypothetical protein
MYLLLPHLTFDPVIFYTESEYPQILLNMEVDVFRSFHSCICASEGVSQNWGKNIATFAKLWTLADRSMSEEVMESVSTKHTGKIGQSDLHELQEVMDFICSQDHIANSRVATLRDTIVGRLAALGFESPLEEHLIPVSILGEVIICVNEMEIYNLLQGLENPRTSRVYLRPMENVCNANQLAWDNIL